MHYPLRFTVFTATYNRASTLHRPYNSLSAQTLRDFEWLIVDDGSTDATRELVETWQREANFPIRYVYQPNRGKPTACNVGVENARGEFFLPLDSDDGCTPNSLERFLYHWDSIPPESQAQFSAVTALCKDQTGKVVGTLFPKDVLDSNSIELTYKHRVRGEKWGFQRTDVLKQFPFPIDAQHKFVSESVVWLTIARKYQTRFVNEPLRIYWIGDGAVDHLTTLRPEVIHGRAACHRLILNELMDWFPKAPMEILRSAINFSRYSFSLGAGPIQQMTQLNSKRARVLLSASMPMAYAISIRDRRLIGPLNPVSHTG